MKNQHFFLSFLLLAAVLVSTSFSAQAQRFSPQAKGAVIGGGSGAILGAVINKRNRAVGGVIGGVVGAGAGYAVGKHIDNRQKKRAAAATEAEREAAYREAAARRTAVASRTTHETIVRTSPGPATALVAAPATALAASNAAYLPNQAPADPANPYANTAYRQRSW